MTALYAFFLELAPYGMLPVLAVFADVAVEAVIPFGGFTVKEYAVAVLAEEALCAADDEVSRVVAGECGVKGE